MKKEQKTDQYKLLLRGSCHGVTEGVVGTDLLICPRRKRGFTLLELLAVLVILAALATIAIPIFSNKSDEAKQTAHKANIATLQKQGQAYLVEVDTPTNPDNIIPEMITKGFLKEIPKYPINDLNTYAVEVVDGRAIVKLNSPVAPTLVITADKPDTTGATSITYTFTFSAPVTGFEASDVTVNVGTKNTLTTVSASVYTMIITNTNIGSTQTVTVADGAATAITGGLASVTASKSIVLAKTGSDLVVGNFVKFGTYAGQPIVWRVIKKEDKNGDSMDDLMLVSDKVLLTKSFDTRWNTIVGGYGYNSWHDSEIRTWLQGAGSFLAGFSTDEAGKILTVTNNTPKATWDVAGPSDTSDTVFLLAESELPILTSANCYANYATTGGNGSYWTRTPYAATSDNNRIVNAGGAVSYDGAYYANSGVRPALFLSPSGITLDGASGLTSGAAIQITVN